MKQTVGAALIAVSVAWCPVVCAAPVIRTLDIRLAVEAAQDWKNEPQWGKTSSEQRYEVSSHRVGHRALVPRGGV